MGQQVSDADIEFAGAGKLGQVVHYSAVEIELPLGTENHARRGEADDLREARQVVDRAVADRAGVVFPVSAHGTREGDAPPVANQQHTSWKCALLHLRFEKSRRGLEPLGDEPGCVPPRPLGFRSLGPLRIHQCLGGPLWYDDPVSSGVFRRQGDGQRPPDGCASGQGTGHGLLSRPRVTPCNQVGSGITGELRQQVGAAERCQKGGLPPRRGQYQLSQGIRHGHVPATANDPDAGGEDHPGILINYGPRRVVGQGTGSRVEAEGGHGIAEEAELTGEPSTRRQVPFLGVDHHGHRATPLPELVQRAPLHQREGAGSDVVGHVLEDPVAHDRGDAVQRDGAPMEEASVPFQGQHLAHRVIEPGYRDASGVHRSDHRLHGGA